MRNLTPWALAFLVLSALPVPADQAEDEAAIRKAVEEINLIHNRHAVEALVALFDEKVESWDGTVKGRKAMAQKLKTLFARETQRLQEELEEIGIVFVTPNVAIYKSRRQVTGQVDRSGKPLPPLKELLARVFVKRDARWFLASWFGSPMTE